MHFQMGKWRFSVWVNMTFLTYLTWIVRCESDMMERSGDMLLCCEGWKEVDVCCVVKELELSSEYFGRYCKKLLNSFCLYFPSYSICKLQFLHGMVEDTAILSLWSFLDLTMHFQMGKWRFSVWVNMTFLTYLTWIVRCESDRMERSGGMLLCCEGTGA